jgi:hypothetical protein
MAAVCTRCGAGRDNFEQVCPHCGHRAEGEGLLIAWLLSDQHLDEAGLENVGARIRAGEVIRPSSQRLERAREALGQVYSSDPGLTVKERLGLLAVSLVLTPLVGLCCWLAWRSTRPRASIQALALSLPASILFLLLWPGVMAMRVGVNFTGL